MEAPVLRAPDFSKPFLVRTDASDYAIGAVISQSDDGADLPVAYESRKLSLVVCGSRPIRLVRGCSVTCKPWHYRAAMREGCNLMSLCVACKALAIGCISTWSFPQFRQLLATC